jgi:hypothetical protein
VIATGATAYWPSHSPRLTGLPTGIVILDGRNRRDGCSVELDNTDVPAGALAVGVPAQIRPRAARPGIAEVGSRWYVEGARRYRRDLRRIG